MHRRHALVASLAALILSSAILSTGCSRNDAGSDVRSGTSSAEVPKPPPVEKPAPEKPAEPAADYDLRFIDTMSRHHKDAVAMARLAASQASRAEIQEFAAKVITDQERQIELMKGWRDQWYSGHSNAGGDMPGMERMGTGGLEGLSGTDFDAKFIEMMTSHHQGGVKMATSGLEKLQHAELKALAQQIADVQTQEIAKMAQWASTGTR
ncbi:MAG TPA: DUF305 domain-containing protein [Candidatus Eisenbacteria bacterium]